jgi:hypothetical protein
MFPPKLLQWVLRRGPSVHLGLAQWPRLVDFWNDLVDKTIFAFLRAIDKGHLPLSFSAENGEMVDLVKEDQGKPELRNARIAGQCRAGTLGLVFGMERRQRCLNPSI